MEIAGFIEQEGNVKDLRIKSKSAGVVILAVLNRVFNGTFPTTAQRLETTNLWYSFSYRIC
jgi:hypothetical protein